MKGNTKGSGSGGDLSSGDLHTHNLNKQASGLSAGLDSAADKDSNTSGGFFSNWFKRTPTATSTSLSLDSGGNQNEGTQGKGT